MIREVSMENTKLIHRQNDALTPTKRASCTPSEATLTKELYLTAQNAKTELDPNLSRAWLKEFSNESREAIEWAFQQWRRTSPFMPAICDISTLLTRYHGYMSVGVFQPPDPKELAALEAWKASEDYAKLRKEIQELDRKLGLKSFPSPAKSPTNEKTITVGGKPGEAGGTQ